MPLIQQVAEMRAEQDLIGLNVSRLKWRKSFFVASSLVCIPASVFLSYTQRSLSPTAPWFDILFFAVLLIPSVSAYLLASKFFSRTKSFLLAVGMFIPTIVVQVIILLALWVGVNRVLSERKLA